MNSLFKTVAVAALTAGAFYLGRNWDSLSAEATASVEAAGGVDLPETDDGVDTPDADTPAE